MEVGDEGRADFLRSVLDRTEAKQQAEASRIVKTQRDAAKENELALKERLADFQEKYKAMRQVEINRLTNSRMTLESAEAFFEEHQRASLERSLRATYGLPA